jgi:hypothetical protein
LVFCPTLIGQQLDEEIFCIPNVVIFLGLLNLLDVCDMRIPRVLVHNVTILSVLHKPPVC